MPDLQILRATSKTLDVDLEDGGELLQFAYRPHVVTPAYLAGGVALGEFVADVVTGWNLTEDGEPVPLDVESVAQRVPLVLQRMVYLAILEDLHPNQTRARGSRSSSFSGD